MNHGVAETPADMQHLLAAASRAAGGDQPVSLLLPTRRADPFRWALARGLRVVKPMTLMSTGQYHEPRAPFYPSVLY